MYFYLLKIIKDIIIIINIIIIIIIIIIMYDQEHITGRLIFTPFSDVLTRKSINNTYI